MKTEGRNNFRGTHHVITVLLWMSSIEVRTSYSKSVLSNSDLCSLRDRLLLQLYHDRSVPCYLS
jgi:hypothetical protein